jgi:hypothetical protein
MIGPALVEKIGVMQGIQHTRGAEIIHDKLIVKKAIMLYS